MLEITTSKEKLSKKVLIDGFTYLVRRPGAGESLTYRQLGREMTKLEGKTKLTKAEEDRYAEMQSRSMSISLELFDPLGDEKAKAHIDSLELQTLLETIAQIFGETKDETEPTDPNA